MNRRDFLRGVLTAAVATGHVLDLDRLLWVPGERSFFLPPAGSFQNFDWITKEAMRLLALKLDASLFREQRAYFTEWPSGTSFTVRKPFYLQNEPPSAPPRHYLDTPRTLTPPRFRARG